MLRASLRLGVQVPFDAILGLVQGDSWLDRLGEASPSLELIGNGCGKGVSGKERKMREGSKREEEKGDLIFTWVFRFLKI